MSTRPSPARRLRRLIILAGMAVLLYLFIGKLVIPFFESGGGNADTQPVPGDPAKFDPVAALPGVLAYAGENSQLTSLEAYYVRSDGTMDLTANYNPYANYETVHKVPTPADAPPVGAGGTINGSWYMRVDIKAYEPGQWRHVTSGSSEYDYMNKGMEREEYKPTTSVPDILPTPVCSFASLWKVALEHDAPANAVATISYDTRGYHFSIRDTSVSFDFDNDCRLQGSQQ